MPYMKFQKEGLSCEIDLEIMSRVRELQEAVAQLQELQGVDTSVIAAAMEAHDSHVAEQEAKEEATQASYLSELQLKMEALDINVPSTLNSSSLKERIEYYERLIAQAEEEQRGES